MKKVILSGCIAVLLTIAAVLCCNVSTFAMEVINNGIFIDGIDMSGKTAGEAKDIIKGRIETAKQAELTITSPTGYSLKVSPTDLGMLWNNPDVADTASGYKIKGNIVQRFKQAKDIEKNHMNFDIDVTYDRKLIRGLIEEHIDDFSSEAVDYELNHEGGDFIIKAGSPGVSVDVDASIEAIMDFLADEWDGKDTTIELVASVDEPLGSANELTSITDIIGTFTTEYKSSGSARCTNVMNGCRLINGTTVYPGEQFSVLDHIAPFTEKNGYKLAGSYLNGLVVDTLGGGICQVSSTLYNAVLLAELQVDERQNHSMIVDYVSPSADAAITEASHKDFKFTNNKDFPIYIEGFTTDDKTITFNIYGVEDRPENREVSYRSEVIERNVPDYENIIQDPAQPVGYTSITSSHAGIKARYIKEVRVDGELVSSEEINKSTYKMVPRTIVVGVSTDNVDIYNQLQAAIATGSVDQVKSTAKALAAQSAAVAAAPPAGDP